MVSDFHEPDALSALRGLATRHDVVALELRDPAENGRLSAGFFRAREAETGRAFVAHGRSRFFDRRLADELVRSGIDHLALSTDRPFITPLRSFLRDRGVRGRNSR